MLDRLKNVGTASVVAVLAFIAFLAAIQASRAKRAERHWRGEAERHQAESRNESLYEAEAAIERAKEAGERAEKAREKTEKRLTAIAEKNDEMRDIVAHWGADRVYNDNYKSVGRN